MNTVVLFICLFACGTDTARSQQQASDTRNPSQQAASTLPNPADRATIEFARETAEKQHQSAEAASHQAAIEYRAEAAQESPDPKALAELQQKLETAVKAAFDAQLKLQQQRLQLAELDLAEVKAKHLRRESLAAKIIERRVADLMSGQDLEWPGMAGKRPANQAAPSNAQQGEMTGNRSGSAGIRPVPTFTTAQELVDFVSKVNADKSLDEFTKLERIFALATDDEINRFAGLMLRTTSMMQMAAGLGAAFGSSDGSDGNVEREQVAAFLKAVGRMNLIVNKYRRENPSPEALAAYQEIAGGLNLSLLFQGASPTASVGATEYSQTLRLAAGVLKDPKSFVVELTKEMQQLAKTPGEAKPVDAKPIVEANWQVTVNGDTATAINLAAKAEATDTFTVADPSARMDLIKVGDTWKISSLIPDTVIVEMQQGPTVTSSSSSDSSGPSPPTMATVQPYSGTNAAVAGTDIRPFTQLNSSNTTTSQVYDKDRAAAAIGTKVTHGKYINRRLMQGEQITADMLIDKPSTEQIVQFWLDEAENRRVVFQHVYQYLTREREFVNTIPYDARHSAKAFNDDLPEWTDAFLQALQQRLESRPIDQWTGEQADLLWSISDVIFFQRSSDNRDLKPIGEIVGRLVSVDNDGLAKFQAPDVRRAAHSGLLLGEVVRLNGSLPASVLELQPTERFIDTKLKLLKQMVENRAEPTWISQEQIRLAGLLNEAPVQALKLLLTAAPIKNRGDLEHWIFAMSSDATYRAWRSSPEEDYSPPVDPVVVIAVAELLAGTNEVIDSNLALLFESQHPGYMFYRHTTDILAGEMACRDSVLQMLVNIYKKSKSPILKARIGQMAPSVPVLAGEGSATSATTSTSPDMDMADGFLLYFYADYCEPCQKMTPLIQRLADSKTLAVHMLDVTKNPKPAVQLKVDRIPTIVVMHQGQVVGRQSGLMSADELNNFIKSPTVLSDTENSTQNTVEIKAASDEAAVRDMAAAKEKNPLEGWLKNIRSIDSDAANKRDGALAEVEAALMSDDAERNIAATQALAQTGDVKYGKAKYRERLLELCRSSNRDLVTSALYALYNTDRKPEDLALVQEVLSQPEAARPAHSISHLLLMFGDGTISGKSEEIVLNLLNSTDRSIRREALRGLWGAKTSDKLMDRVIELVDVPESHNDAIYFALSTSPDKNEAVVDKLIEVLSDPDWNNWDRALWGLGYGVREAQQEKVADAMLQMYENRSDPKTRGKCAKLIQQFGSDEQKDKLQHLSSTPHNTSE